MAHERQQHFLVVVIGGQGHINPARHLASCLARTSGVTVSIAIPIQTLRRMFPSQEPKIVELDGGGGLVSYVPYSDGIEEDGLEPHIDIRHLPNYRNRIVHSLTAIATHFSARGRPVTCMVNTLLLPMVADVAREVGVPYILFWIQPAAVFSIYHHFFNLSPDPSSSLEIPGLPQLQVQDLPSVVTAHNSADSGLISFLFALIQELFELIKKEISAGARPKVLLNTFDDLEQDVLSGIKDIEMIPIGPLVVPFASSIASADLFQQDATPYMEWLGTKQERSVVYVSFGSLSTMPKAQLEEILAGLQKSGRPYLCVLRRDSRGGGVEFWDDANGLVVEWCDQRRVLSHPAIGCFVTHCGWNSMLESMVAGVPTVVVPQWLDQATNARLAEEWGLGVRAAVNGEGVMEGGELARCLELVMGEGGGTSTMRRTVEMWREKARAAAEEGGSSDRNLRDFVNRGFGGSTAAHGVAPDGREDP